MWPNPAQTMGSTLKWLKIVVPMVRCDVRESIQLDKLFSTSGSLT